ncbi:hypothetical protein BDP27DRAFT_1451484 [Rhodocollybia butyracea]|uniref:Uncharacterized protein n=1 Tax=Rhodocollybia butyracea TaxID=206335 RepID=A0A9P5PJ26_9AGAR|nr:hypothetical protein BDP27DRAFT_1451484 [Rhodocollybia butyracea]
MSESVNSTSDPLESQPNRATKPPQLQSTYLRSSANTNMDHVSDLTREFWDTRRKMSALFARCLVIIEKELETMGKICTTSQEEEEGQEKGLVRELEEAERSLQGQRKQRQETSEMVLADV